jgi:hypothetical protein
MHTIDHCQAHAESRRRRLVEDAHIHRIRRQTARRRKQEIQRPQRAATRGDPAPTTVHPADTSQGPATGTDRLRVPRQPITGASYR